MNDLNVEQNRRNLAEKVKELSLNTAGQKTAPQKGGTSWLPWILCVLLAFGWAGFGIKWFRGEAAKKSDPLPTAQGSKTLTKPADSNDNTPTGADEIALEVKGYLIPTKQLSVSPIDVAGRVTMLNIEEGKAFKKGDILAEIDQTPYRAMVAEAKASVQATEARLSEMRNGSRREEVEQAEAELKEAQVSLEQYKNEWVRYEGTGRTGLTTKEYEAVEANYKSAVQRVEARKKNLKLIKDGPRVERIEEAVANNEVAKARLAQSMWKLDNCVIVSPVNGVILTKSAEVGSLINPVVGGVSTSLCNIADLRQMEVELDVQQRDISKVQLFQKCKIKPDSYPDRIYQGYVERVMPIANRSKEIVSVRVKVIFNKDEPQGKYLKPEMSVTVTLFGGKYNEAEVKKLLEQNNAEEATTPEKKLIPMIAPKMPETPKKD